MKIWKLCAISVACAAAFSLSLPDDAEARRLGGGRSFGGSPSFNRPAPAPTAPRGATTTQPGTTMNRQATNPGAAGAGAATAGRGMGMGLFGGLLAGSLIGSLLLGGGFAGGGFLDIIIIGLLIYVVVRVVRGRNASANQETRRVSPQDNPTYGSNASPSAWDSLRSSSPQSGDSQFTSPTSQSVPVDFDQEDFLRGAKMAYVRLQESWDKRDLDDVAQFATPSVLEALRQQMAEEPEPSTTDLLLVNASLLEVKKEGDEERAAVLFDVLMREDASQDAPEQVREVWHFVQRPGRDLSWKLDGIQQIA